METPRRPRGRPAQMSLKPPSYRLHKFSGQATVTLRDAVSGRRQDVLLGSYGSPESHAEYRRVLGEWELAGRRLDAERRAPDLTINELALAYYRYAEAYYTKNGRPTDEANRVKMALRPMKELYGHTPAREFGPLALKAVREQFLRHTCGFCGGTGQRGEETAEEAEEAVCRSCGRCRGLGVKGYPRRLANQLTAVLKRMFRWAVAEEMLAVAVSQALDTVAGLRKGKVSAREHIPVKPVRAELVEKTLPHLSLHVRAMVRLQMLTGARPGEVCLLKPEHLDLTGEVWVWRPQEHSKRPADHR